VRYLRLSGTLLLTAMATFAASMSFYITLKPATGRVVP
jgi:hypothetical protein